VQKREKIRPGNKEKIKTVFERHTGLNIFFEGEDPLKDWENCRPQKGKKFLREDRKGEKA